MFHIVMLEPFLMSTQCVSFSVVKLLSDNIFQLFCLFADNIFHLAVHYVCYNILVQRFEPQGWRFTNFHYYYY